MATTYQPAAEALKPAPIPESFRYFHDLDPASSPGVAAAHNYLKSSFEKAEGFNKRRQLADKEITLAANLREVARSADALKAERETALSSARVTLATAKRDTEAAIAAKLALKPSAKAGEIREVLRAMKPAVREAAVREAFRADDKEVLSAVVGEPALLTGVNPEVVQVELAAYTERLAPAESAIAKAQDKAERYLENASKDAIGFHARIYEGTNKYADERKVAEAVLSSYGMKFDAPAPVKVVDSELNVQLADPSKPLLRGDGTVA